MILNQSPSLCKAGAHQRYRKIPQRAVTTVRALGLDLYWIYLFASPPLHILQILVRNTGFCIFIECKCVALTTAVILHLTEATLHLFVAHISFLHTRAHFDLSHWKRLMGTAKNVSAKFANKVHTLAQVFFFFFAFVDKLIT